MSEIQTIEKGKLVLHREVLLKNVNCIMKSKDKKSKQEAESHLESMFNDMVIAFNAGRAVYYKNSEQEKHIVFKSMNQFKVWLIVDQILPSFKTLLEYLKEYCAKHNIVLPRLNIVFGDYYEDTIYNTEVYFRNTYRPEWLDAEIIKKAIKTVDKSIVINRNAIDSPVFGIMPPAKLSGGVKTLMLMYNNPNMVFNASTCGDNCVKFIEEIAKDKDIIIGLYHAMDFSKKNFKAYIVNGDIVTDSYIDYIQYADKYCRS